MLELSAGAKSRSLESRLGIPEKPRKPLTPFFQFMTEVRASVTAAHPQLPLQQIVKAIGAKWETVDEKQKQVYLENFKKAQVCWNTFPEQLGTHFEMYFSKSFIGSLSAKSCPIRKPIDRRAETPAPRAEGPNQRKSHQVGSAQASPRSGSSETCHVRIPALSS